MAVHLAQGGLIESGLLVIEMGDTMTDVDELKFLWS